MNQKKRLEILFILSKIYVEPKIELNFSSEFELLIAVMLSAKSTDKAVNKVTKNLFKFANTPLDFLKLGLENIKKYLKDIGLFNKKSDFIFRTCKIILSKYNGNVPNNRQDLESLPGVGRKTANVILNQIFGHKTIAVDTHVFRLSNRIGFATGKSVFLVEKKLMKVVPEKFRSTFHMLFILHGKHVCSSKKPKCYICSISHLCEFIGKLVEMGI